MISSQFIQSCQSGDENAIQSLVQTHQRAVFQLVLSIIDDGLGDDSPVSTAASASPATMEAEAATRETFIAAIDRLGRYREDSSFESWLYAIAIQVSRRRARRWKLRRAVAGIFRQVWRAVARQTPTRDTAAPQPVQAAEQPTADKPTTEHPGDKGRQSPGDTELWNSVRRLDEKLRVPIVLRYYHDYPIAEIAHLLHISEGSVHARLDAAREKIAFQVVE